MNNVLIALDKIEQLRTAGFTVTNNELEAITASPVESGNGDVFKYAVMLSRLAKNKNLTVTDLDLAETIPRDFLGEDAKLCRPQYLAIYTLAKDIAVRLYGTTIHAYDADFYDELSTYGQSADVRERIKCRMYCVVEEGDYIRTYGLTRLAGTNPKNGDVEINLSGLDEESKRAVFMDVVNHIESRLTVGKLPTLPIHLESFGIVKLTKVKMYATFKPFITPNKILCTVFES